MPPAARVTDIHVCALLQAPAGPIKSGATTVMVDALPAARLGDPVECPIEPDQIVTGSATVMIDGAPAARLGDTTKHGGPISVGATTVMVG